MLSITVKSSVFLKMGHTIEGFVERVNTRQLEYISEVLDKHGFGQAKVVMEVVGKAGDNYSADVRRVVAEQEGRELRMIAKIATTNEMMRETMSTRQMFVNEAKMYTEVLTKYGQLERSAGILEDDRLKYATCFGALLEEFNEIILLEDLQPNGYAILDRLKPLPNEIIRVILKNLAKLHGYSYVLRHTDPKTFVSLSGSFYDVWENMEKLDDMKVAMLKMEEDIINTLNDEHYAKYIRGRLANFAELGLEVLKKDKLNSKYSALQHGDAWTNNILFQMEEGNVMSCCMIDYQLPKLANPALDIGYMVYNCTDYETRAKHYHDWIDFYHHQLDGVLSNFGLKANMVYSRVRLDADLKRYAEVTLVNTVFVSCFTVRESDDAARVKATLHNHDAEKNDMEKFAEMANMSNSGDKTVDVFKTKVKGIVDSFVELGYV